MDEKRFFPPVGSSEADLLAYRDRVINRWSIVRNQNMGRAALSVWYMLGRQWAEFDYAAAFDGVRGAIIRDMENSDLPRPITNQISPAIEAEVIALVKKGWIPKVTPQDTDPSIKAAAQISNDILNYRLEELSWPEKRHELGLHFAATGTGLIYTGWDKSYFDLKPIGAPSAVYCPKCSTKLYSADVPVDLLKQGIQGKPVQFLSDARDTPKELAPLDDDGMPLPMARLGFCPTCPEPVGLKPYEPNEEEAAEGEDVFGRPLGVQVPRGGSTLEIDLPFEWYPQNAGIRVTPSTLKKWGRRKIRSLEWIEERAPHLVADIEPDTPSELLYDDPLLGEWGVLGFWSPALDSGVLDNHANVDEVVEEPTFRNPLGRYLLCTKDKVLEDTDLLEKQVIDGEEVYVPRVQESVSRYKIRPGEIWGTSLPEEVISPQNRLNGLDAQVIEARLRTGSPNMFMTPGMWFAEGPVVNSAYGVGKIFIFQPDPAHPEMVKPEVFGGELMPDSVYLERDRTKQDIKEIVGPTAVSGGNPPKNIGTTSGLEVLIEQDQESRSLREDELTRSAEKSWSHIQRLEWVLRVDTDTYKVLGPDKAWKYEQYRGSALRGQTEVKIERQPFLAKSLIKREAAREALADGLIVVDGPVPRRKMLEAYGLDTNINEDTNNQVDQAERQWVDFVQKGIVRVQDSIDDPQIRYQVLGTHLLTDQGQKLTEEAGWDEVNRKIAGWQDELQKIIMLEQQSIAFYGGRLVGDDAAEAYAKAELAYQDQLETFAAQQKVAGALQESVPPGTPPPPAPMAPQKPPPPVQIPVLLQDRILMIWKSMIEKVDGAAEEPPPPPDVDASMKMDPDLYMRMRALVEAYKLSIAPGPMAPGTGATSLPIDKGLPAGPGAGPAPTNPTAPMPEGGPH